MYYNLSSHKRNQYDIAANECDLDPIHKVWAQTQTSYIWRPSTILADAEPALLNPYNPAAIGIAARLILIDNFHETIRQ